MVQMIGVVVLAGGVPRMFASIEQSGQLDNSIMVLGYVIMRVALVFQWLRAAKDDPARRRVCHLCGNDLDRSSRVGGAGPRSSSAFRRDHSRRHPRTH